MLRTVVRYDGNFYFNLSTWATQRAMLVGMRYQLYCCTLNSRAMLSCENDTVAVAISRDRG